MAGYHILISVVIRMTIAITVPAIQTGKEEMGKFYLFALYKLAVMLFKTALVEKPGGKRWRQRSLLSCV